jgi:hypothetical protein
LPDLPKTANYGRVGQTVAFDNPIAGEQFVTSPLFAGKFIEEMAEK